MTARRSGAVTLGPGYRRVVAAAMSGGFALAGLAACGDDDQVDAQPVCGYEDGTGDFIVVNPERCDDDDEGRSSVGHTLLWFHMPTGQAYVPGARFPVSSAYSSVRPSTVGKGYGAGTVRTGGFGSKAGTGGGGAPAGKAGAGG